MSHLDKLHLLRDCVVGDVIFLHDFERREYYGLPARALVLAHCDTSTRMENIMLGSVNPNHKVWVPSQTLVHQVFSDVEKRNARAPWNF